MCNTEWDMEWVARDSLGKFVDTMKQRPQSTGTAEPNFSIVLDRVKVSPHPLLPPPPSPHPLLPPHPHHTLSYPLPPIPIPSDPPVSVRSAIPTNPTPSATTSCLGCLLLSGSPGNSAPTAHSMMPSHSDAGKTGGREQAGQRGRGL